MEHCANTRKRRIVQKWPIMIHVDHYTIDVGDKTEIFMSVEYGFFFLRVFHKLKPPLPQNEILLISKKK